LKERFDVVFIGGGPAGYTGAVRGAQLGGRIAVVEKGLLGGVCLHRGCIPTKALYSSVNVLKTCRESGDFGINLPGGVSWDLPALMSRKDKIVKTLVKGIHDIFKSHGIKVYTGEGRFLDGRSISVKQGEGTVVELESKATVIATGSRPAIIPAFPINGRNILSSDYLFELESIPESILIIGGGAIGCEWGFILNGLGVDVTIIEMLDHAAPVEDEDTSILLEREMKKRKIKILTGDKILSLGESPDKEMVAQTESGREIRVEKVLVSIGRARNTDSLSLKSAGVELDDKGCVSVNHKMETTAAGIYAAGDVVNTPLLAHVAFAEGKVAAANALGGSEVMDYAVIPTAMFTFPEVGSVGLREGEARDKGIEYSVARFPFRALGKAHAQGEIAGEVKLVAEPGTGRILGAHIIGPGASMLVHEAAMAMRLGGTADDLSKTIHAHPTLSEAVMEAGEALLGRAIHIPRK
jgi:dihydrolipoamide dehydrogenase